MKKLKLNPLQLDKETIAKLDEKQLQEIVGGVNEETFGTTTACDHSCTPGNSCNGSGLPETV